MAEDIFENFKAVKLFVFDVDGVMTDGQLLVLEDGTELRSMDVKDGFAIKRALEENFKILVISGKSSKALEQRLANLGIQDIYLGEPNKQKVLEKFLMEFGIDKRAVLAVGDDLPDREILNASGLATCPKDGVPEIAKLCDYQSGQPGGHGCIRDIVEKTLKIQGLWDY